MSSANAVVGVDNDQNSQPTDPRLTEGLARLASQESQAPDAVTRQRHLRSMRRVGLQRRMAPIAAAAAVVALLAGGITALNQNGADETRNLASGDFELPVLREAPELSPVPFERTEDYVILSVDASRADDVANQLSTAMGGDVPVVGKTDALTTFVVPQSAAQTLTDTTGVSAVRDTPIASTAQQSPTPSWGLDRIDAAATPLDNSYSYVNTGAGTITYVIDTGVYSSHSDLSGRVISGYSAVADGNGSEDCNGHGTHVAGTIAGRTYGVAKSATVVAVRVLDCAGSGYASSVVAGINWVVASHPGGPGVINMSLGGGANSAIDSAVNSASAAGLIVAVAAGNSAADACSFSPARAASALTIGATDRTDAKAGYSNDGSCVDMWAPGSSITSAWIGGSGATNTISGTSMATPHVAGLAARLFQANPGISASGVKDILTASSNNNGATFPIVSLVEEDVPVDSTTTTISDVTTTTVESPTTTTTPVVTTTVPKSTTTTTVKPRPGNSGNTPGSKKSPGQNKSVVQPKEFEMKYDTRDGVDALVASWVDDGTPEAYRLECSAAKGGNNATIDTALTVERANVKVTAVGRTETILTLAPTASMRCWVVATIGTSVSAQSNPAIVPVRRVPTAPTTVPATPPTNAPANQSGPGNSGNSGKPNAGNSGNQNNNSGNPGRSNNSPTTSVASIDAIPTTTVARGNSGNPNAGGNSNNSTTQNNNSGGSNKPNQPGKGG